VAEKSSEGEKSAFDLMQQFDITPLSVLADTPFAFVTNSAFFMLLTVAVIAFLMIIMTANAKVIPGRGQTISEMIFDFGFGMVDDILGKDGRPYVTFLLSVFLFVFVANILGMLPYSFTVFSHISLTAFMAVVIFLMVIYVGVSRHGLGWFGIFAPAGVPGWLLPLIVVIEIISFFMRPLTHSLRLFANLTAGHIVLKVIGTFAAGAGATSLLTIVGGLLLTPVLFALSALEYLVAYLQAYIFTLLAAVYLSEAIDPHH
jgi:F-type H+-transporting ATPase subunit a